MVQVRVPGWDWRGEDMGMGRVKRGVVVAMMYD